jgi:hypothetical protein
MKRRNGAAVPLREDWNEKAECIDAARRNINIPRLARRAPEKFLRRSFGALPMHRCRLSRVWLFALLLAGVSACLGGCASADAVRAAQGSMTRAMRVENPGAFFGPVLARALGEPATDNLTPQARQHYFAIIADLEGLSPRDREDLRRAGLLGDALTLRALAQWRLGRLAAATDTAQDARATGQEPPSARDRVLLTSLEGVVQLEAAITAAQGGASYEKITELIRGENGAWRLLGLARAEVAHSDESLPELIEARLAAVKVLKDAHDKYFAGVILPPGGDEAWDRVRAEAQAELADFAAASARDPVAHAARVREWQVACGLDAPAR